MQAIIDGYRRLAKIISWFCGLIAALAAVVMTLMTVGDVLMRYFFNKPILGSFELTEYLLVIVVFFAIPWATMEGAHVRVDLITGRFVRKTQGILYAISCILSMIITFLFACYTFPEAKYVLELGEQSDMLNIPAYPFYYLVGIGFFVIFFVLIAVFFQYIEEAVSK